MDKLLRLTKKLKKAAKNNDVLKCIEISESITKLMDTYKRSC